MTQNVKLKLIWIELRKDKINLASFIAVVEEDCANFPLSFQVVNKPVVIPFVYSPSYTEKTDLLA